MTLPTADEINVYDSLDEREACKNYLGKSLGEVRLMLDSGIGNYWEDLAWMGPKAFEFYLPTVIDVVHAAIDVCETSVYSDFLCLMQVRLVLDPGSLCELRDTLRGICQKIQSQIPGLDPEEVEIYDLPRRTGDVDFRLEYLK